jgi:hypothetical protein
MIKRTLKLTYPWHEDIDQGEGRIAVYRVEQVQNTIEYEPHQFLQKEEVARLCNKVSWTITITAPAVPR